MVVSSVERFAQIAASFARSADFRRDFLAGIRDDDVLRGLNSVVQERAKELALLGRIQPRRLTPRVVLTENSASTLECCDIRHSIKHRSVPLVGEPDSRRLPTTSEALAGAGIVYVNPNYALASGIDFNTLPTPGPRSGY